MRSILRHTPLNTFSSSKLNQVIQNRIEHINQQQKNNYLKYEEMFFKLYTLHLQRQSTVQANVKKLDTICMVNEFPCKSIVQHFLSTGKSYSQQYVVQTFIRLARAYKISQADNSSTADFSIHRLFFTPAFENLIQQYKFGLKKQNSMTWNNTFLVAECLIDIGYVDYQVFSILINMIETRVQKQQRNQIEIRPFQIQKRDYYQKRTRNTQQNLAQDTQFRSVLKLLSQKVRKFEQRTKSKNILQQVKRQLSTDQQSKNLYNSIIESVSMVQSFNKDLTQLIQGILIVRKQYRKMVQLSESKQILRNPQLNLQLLELQEMLLSKKLISLSDIKFSQRIQNQSLELRRIQQILISMIEPAQGLPLNFTTEVGQLLNTSFSEPQNKQMQRLNRLKDIAEYGRGMAILSRFAEVSRRLYNAPDSRSLISMKWQKTLLMWNKQGTQNSQSRQNLHPQKIFRRTFVDLYKMMKKSYSIFMFYFVEVPLKYKVQFFESLIRLGYYDQLIELFGSQDTSRQKVQTYSTSQFASLVKILNQIGDKIPADHLKKSTLKHLKKLYQNSQFEQNSSLFNMQFCINAINFICQNFNVISVDLTYNMQSKDQIQILYQNLVNRLAQQVKYLQQTDNFLTNDHHYEALRILSMQRSGQFKFNNLFYRRFNIDPTNPKQLKQFLYRKNPFFSITQQLVQPYAQHSIKNNHPFIETGFNSKGELTAVLLCSSDQSQIKGKHVNGNTNAYIHRIKRQYNISITPLNVNSLLDIDYDKISTNQQFSFKSKEQIAKILNQLFRRDELNLYQFSAIISNISVQLEKHFKKNYLLALVKFLNTLNQCAKLFQRQKQISSYELFRFRRYRLFVQLDTLKEDYNALDKTVKDELQKMWKKQVSSIQSFKKSASVLDFISNIQQNIIQSASKNQQSIKTFTKDLFQGKRFTIDAFVQNSDEFKKNIGIQFINSTVYIDKTFCQYRDWAQQLGQKYPVSAIKLSQSSNITKILTKKYLPNVRQQINVLPWTKKQSLAKKPQFDFHSLQAKSSLLQNKNVSKQDNSKNYLTQSHLNTVKTLLQYIHELKISKSQQQLAQYVFSFDFISNIASQKPSGKNQHNSQLIHRSFDEYLNYLQMRNNKFYLESPNLEYLFKKFDQKQEISDVFNSRKERRNKIKMQYQLGKLNRKEYYNKIQQIDNQIISKLKGLQKNLLDNVQEYKIFESGLKMIKIQQNQKQIQRVLNRQRYYDRNIDKDYIHVKGNKERLMRIKRNKAERILSLYKVLYKLSKNQTESITQEDKNVIKRQSNFIQHRLQHQKDASEVFSEKFTHLTVADLSKGDKQRLRLKGVDLSKIENLSLSDLILELNNLLDIKVYQNFQKLIVKKHYAAQHNVPEEIFAATINKQFSKLAGEQQRAIINEHSKLDFYELGLLNEMVQTFKTQSKTGKQRFAELYQTFYQDVQQMNTSEARVELISQYLNLKELQYSERYNPRLVTELKEREVMKLWNIIFKKAYSQCSTQQIQKMTGKICERVRLMGQNPPPFFGLLVIKILQHPQTDALTKQNLIANIQFSKVPLQIDSEDVRVLGFGCSSQEKANNETSQQLIQHMASTSNKNFMENLNKKINMIL